MSATTQTESESGYMNNKKYIASMSGGKDSVAMVLRIIELGLPLDEVIYFNNGMDYTAIYDVIKNYVTPELEKHGIMLRELHPKHNFLYQMFEREVHKKDGSIQCGYQWCGGTARWGTADKTSAIKNYLKTLDCEVVQYIGIAADEPKRIKYENGKQYPLVDWGWTEADCLKYCRERGVKWIEHTSKGDVDLYDILDRVSCWCCSNKNLKEMKAMYQYLPEYWEELKRYQSMIDRPFKRYGNVFEIEERFKKELTK